MLALDLGVLGDRLDDDVAAGQLVEVGDHARRPSTVSPARSAELLAARPDDHLVVLGGGPREAARDRPAADYSQLHEPHSRPLVDWSVNGVGLPQATSEAAPMQNGNGREVVIVEAVRTPIGRGHPEKGYYKDTHPNELLGKTYTEVIERAGIDASEVEDVITGCVQQYGEQMFNVGRNAWLQAGLPIETPATTVDRQCGSAQQAVNFAAALIASGVHDAAIGSGVEHMGHIPMGVGLQVGRRRRLALAARS